MEINPKVKAVVNSSNITNKPSAIALLLAVYYKCSQATCFSETLKAQVFSLGIFTVGKTGIEWLIPLFNNQESNFEWVSEFRQMFKSRNKSRAGDLRACIVRMKEFFSSNPHIRKDQVMQATEKYLASVTDPSYICTSQYFIFKGKGLDRTSPLEQWIEEVVEEENLPTNGISGLNRMLD